MWAENMAKSKYSKKSGKKIKKYCKLICFANILNFRGSLCQIKMLTNFSKKLVLPEFWAWEHLWTLHVFSWDSSLTLWQQKIPTNYCKLTLHAIFMKLLGSLHNILKIFLFLLNSLYSIIVDSQNKLSSKNGHLCG